MYLIYYSLNTLKDPDAPRPDRGVKRNRIRVKIERLHQEVLRIVRVFDRLLTGDDTTCDKLLQVIVQSVHTL